MKDSYYNKNKQAKSKIIKINLNQQNVKENSYKEK